MARASSPLELRVLAGPQAGARTAIAPGAAVRIGGAPGATLAGPAAPDILLVGGAGFTLAVRWPDGGAVAGDRELAGPAELTLVDGTARLGGEALQPGQPRPWRMRQPLALGEGEVVLAFGPAAQAAWAPADASEPTAPAQAAAPAATGTLPGPERWLVTAGLALLIVGVGLLSLVDLLTPAQAGVAAAALPQATPRPPPADDTAHAVAEVFRLHGVAAEARAAADGGVRVEARERDAWRVGRAEQAVRRDVPGLGRLTVSNQPPPTAPAARAPLAADPGKRITAVVDDAERPYFVTADGSRYFTGALLPSGHRVVSIADRAVTVERDGQLTRLAL